MKPQSFKSLQTIQDCLKSDREKRNPAEETLEAIRELSRSDPSALVHFIHDCGRDLRKQLESDDLASIDLSDVDYELADAFVLIMRALGPDAGEHKTTITRVAEEALKSLTPDACGNSYLAERSHAIATLWLAAFGKTKTPPKLESDHRTYRLLFGDLLDIGCVDVLPANVPPKHYMELATIPLDDMAVFPAEIAMARRDAWLKRCALHHVERFRQNTDAKRPPAR